MKKPKFVVLDKKEYEQLEEDAAMLNHIKRLIFDTESFGIKSYKYGNYYNLIRHLDYLQDVFKNKNTGLSIERRVKGKKFDINQYPYHPVFTIEQYLTLYQTLHIMREIIMDLHMNDYIPESNMTSEELKLYKKNFEKHESEWWGCKLWRP